MNKILIIFLCLGIIIGLMGTSIALEGYTKVKELKEINSKGLCDRESEMNVTKKQCKEGDKERQFKLKNTHIQIDVLENNGTEVLKIYAK